MGTRKGIPIKKCPTCGESSSGLFAPVHPDMTIQQPTNPDKPVEYGELVYKIKDHLTDIDRDFHALEYRLFEQAITAIKTLQAENERLQDDKEALLNCLKTCLFGSIDLNKNQLFAEYKRHRPHTKQQLKKQ